MRIALVIFAGLVLSSVASTAQSASEEEMTYRSYLRELKAMESIDDSRIDKYLSQTALRKWSEVRNDPGSGNCASCPSPEEALDRVKTLRPFPRAEHRPIKTSSVGVTKLTFKWRELPGTPNGGPLGRNMTVIVELIKEEEWKLKSESWVTSDKSGMNFPGRSAWSH
jgi:hypothetical protein